MPAELLDGQDRHKLLAVWLRGWVPGRREQEFTQQMQPHLSIWTAQIG
jgi:hypothetical protein